MYFLVFNQPQLYLLLSFPSSRPLRLGGSLDQTHQDTKDFKSSA
jgi:hypothetical protein